MTAGWIYVGKGKGTRAREKPCAADVSLSADQDETLDLEVAKQLSAEISRISDDPQFQTYVEEVLHSARLPFAIRCLGIGSLRSLPSKFQFALAHRLNQRLNTPSENSRASCEGIDDDSKNAATSGCAWYDPIMSATDKLAGELLQVPVDEAARDGTYKVHVPTLFFMPHCELDLYEVVIRQNSDNLDKVVVIGNSFDHYHLRNITAPALPAAIETPLPTFAREERAFNDLHILHFPQHVWRAWPVPANTNVGEIVSVNLKSNRLEGRAVIVEEEKDNRTFVRFLLDDTTAHVRRQRIRGVASRPTVLLCSKTCHYRQMAATQLWTDDVVLEIGCSTGECTEVLSFHAKDIVAVDVSSAQILECRQRDIPGPALVEWLCMDAFSPEHWRKLIATRSSYSAVFIDIGGDRRGDAVFELIRLVLRDICPSFVAVKSEELAAMNLDGTFLDGAQIKKPQWSKLQQIRKYRRAIALERI
eukprot:GEMP01046638.1.p1 GENE.GEMP01046638.1~~GEMP01046638.1.p1  ORF type:complete len:495 (+),score=114.33 GEMP01046638.1:63-1487(+)